MGLGSPCFWLALCMICSHWASLGNADVNSAVLTFEETSYMKFSTSHIFWFDDIALNKTDKNDCPPEAYTLRKRERETIK